MQYDTQIFEKNVWSDTAQDEYDAVLSINTEQEQCTPWLCDFDTARIKTILHEDGYLDRDECIRKFGLDDVNRMEKLATEDWYEDNKHRFPSLY